MESPKPGDNKGLHVTCVHHHIAVILQWGIKGLTCVFCQSIKAELKKLALLLNHQSLNRETGNLEPSESFNTPSEVSHRPHTAQPEGVDLRGVDSAHPGGVDPRGVDSAYPGGVDLRGVDSAHPGGVDLRGVDSDNNPGVDLRGVNSANNPGVDQGRVDSACKPCLDIKSEIDKCIHSERTVRREPYALKTIGNRELMGFRLNKETLLHIKEEHLEEKQCIAERSEGENHIQVDIAPHTLRSPLAKSLGLGLPLNVPDIDSIVPTETIHNEQLGPSVTTNVTLYDRGMEPVHNKLGDAMSKKKKTVKMDVSHVRGQGEQHQGDICGKEKFIEMEQLKVPKSTHTKEQPNKGGACGKGMVLKNSPLVHDQTHTGRKPSVCKLGDKNDSGVETSQTQISNCTSEKLDDCGRQFSRTSSLSVHSKVDVCGKGFSVERGGTNHKEMLKEEKPYKCNLCDKTFAWKCEVLRHNRTHTGEKPDTCDICCKGFLDKSTLAKHKIVHTGEKPYKCDICGKGFSRKHYSLVHKRTHTGEKPNTCDVCGKRFLDKSTLTRHKIIHSEVKPYECDICGKGFSRKQRFLVHNRMHTGEKPHVCDVCCKGFVDRSTLAKHKMTHTAEKPCICDICGKGFDYQSKLASHKLTHAGKKPYKCYICCKGFARKEHLVRHRRTHTGEKP